MKVRKAKKSENSKRRAREAARQDAEIADLKTQLVKALALVNAQSEQIKTVRGVPREFPGSSGDTNSFWLFG